MNSKNVPNQKELLLHSNHPHISQPGFTNIPSPEELTYINRKSELLGKLVILSEEIQITIRQILDLKITERPTLSWKVRQLEMAEAFYNTQFLKETV